MSKKAAEHHKKAAEHHTHAARHHGEAANITKAGGTNKRGIMHTPPGATRFTLEITPKKLLKPTWRNTARNSC